MTIHEVSKQIYDLAIGHFINHQKVSRKWIDEYISRVFDGSEYKYCLLEIPMADGWFPCLVYRYSEKCFDYSIAEQKDKSDNFKKFLSGFYQERNLNQ